MEYGAAEFYSLGLGDPYPLSAVNGSGTGDFLDMLVSKFPKKESQAEELEELPKIAVVGRPNAGKSSLINALLDEDRTIVTEIAGTTRDTIYTRYSKFNFDFYLIDTAGIRKKGKVTEDLEYYSVVRSIRAIENADVCVLMIDATRGIEAQDMNIFSLIQKNKKGMVVAVNKWDLVEGKDNQSVKVMEDAIRQRFAPFVDFPIVFTSATTKQRIYKVLDTVKQVHETQKRHINTNQLNEFFLPLIEHTPPPAIKGKYIKVKYVTQLKGPMTPTFIFFCSLPQYVKDPYKRFLENRLREQWDFCGVQLQLFFRQK
jgi:GTP-binding protein